MHAYKGQLIAFFVACFFMCGIFGCILVLTLLVVTFLVWISCTGTLSHELTMGRPFGAMQKAKGPNCFVQNWAIPLKTFIF